MENGKIKTYKETFIPIRFPQDEQKHNHIIEWWYFNGNLESKDGQTFSYMNCLFAADAKKVEIPFLKNGPFKQLFFSHCLLSNNKNSFENRTNPICILDQNSFTKPLLWINYDNSCLIEETAPFKYHVVNDFIDLTLESRKKPLLLNKSGFLDLEVKTTYYYSLTHLKTTGIVKHKDKWIKVNGLSWMDHQWAQTPLTSDDKWRWFSLQLNNNCEVICFVYGNKIKTSHASMLNENNKIKTTNNVEIIPGKITYKNKLTKNEYYLDYTIRIPDFNLELKTVPFKKDQEMIFETIRYWEGGISIEGIMNGQKVKGKGFCELVTSDRGNFVNYLIRKSKENPFKNIKSISDLSIKSIYLLNEKRKNKN
jgi:predicted secreted hydrolase